MSSMNRGRVIVGGLVAGVILVIIDFSFSALVAPYIAAHPGAMNAAILAAGDAAGGTVGAVVKDMLNGLAIVWCYAAIRPRFGAGPRTAAYAAVLAWSFVFAFIAVVYSFRFVSFGLACIFSLMYLVQFLIAAFVGGLLYREGAAAAT